MADSNKVEKVLAPGGSGANVVYRLGYYNICLPKTKQSEEHTNCSLKKKNMSERHQKMVLEVFVYLAAFFGLGPNLWLRKCWKLELIFRSGTGVQDWYRVLAPWLHLSNNLSCGLSFLWGRLLVST